MAIFRRKSIHQINPIYPFDEFFNRFLSNKNAVNLFDVAVKLNIEIVYKSLEPEVSFYLRKTGTQWVGIINSNHSSNRKNFSLALIIGTY